MQRTIILGLIAILATGTVCASESEGMDSTILLDNRFSGFDAIAHVRREHPQLDGLAEAISHWAGYYSVNPIVLAREVAQAPSVPKNADGVKRLAAALAEMGRAQVQATPPQSPESTSADQPPVMDLPFAYPQAWLFNGVHTWTGSDDGAPMSSIDFVESWQQRWGDDTSANLVAAAHDGEVTVFSSCFVHVQHPGGWGTRYYHLDGLVVENGQQVLAGQALGVYAGIESQALCGGGHSTGPHLHFALTHDNQYTEIGNHAFSGYLVHPGEYSYDARASHMWLEKRGEKYFGYARKIAHETGDSIIDYRYNGMWYTPEHDGHGVNIEISEFTDGEGSRKSVFVIVYTYDDDREANFYVGASEFERWRSDETMSINMLQTSGGNLADLLPIDFDDPGQATPAGSVQVRFFDCGQAQVDLMLIDRVSGQVAHQPLQLTRLIGVPDHACNAASLPLE